MKDLLLALVIVFLIISNVCLVMQTVNNTQDIQYLCDSLVHADKQIKTLEKRTDKIQRIQNSDIDLEDLRKYE